MFSAIEQTKQIAVIPYIELCRFNLTAMLRILHAVWTVKHWPLMRLGVIAGERPGCARACQ